MKKCTCKHKCVDIEKSDEHNGMGIATNSKGCEMHKMKTKFRLWTKKEFMGAGKVDKQLAIRWAKENVEEKLEEIEKMKWEVLKLKDKVKQARNRKVISERKSYEEYVKEETELREKEGYEVVK